MDSGGGWLVMAGGVDVSAVHAPAGAALGVLRLGGDVGDGAAGLDAYHEPVAALGGQRRVTVCHGRRVLSWTDWAT